MDEVIRKKIIRFGDDMKMVSKVIRKKVTRF